MYMQNMMKQTTLKYIPSKVTAKLHACCLGHCFAQGVAHSPLAPGDTQTQAAPLWMGHQNMKNSYCVVINSCINSNNVGFLIEAKHLPNISQIYF